MRPRFGLTTALTVALLASGTMTFAQAVSPKAAGVAAVPRPDHVVVVIEENHSGTEIVGNPSAPYISSLAADNADFTQSYAVTHPSEPNYLALFSGSTQRLTDDSCPHSYDTPTLADSLLAAGLGFTEYSEGLPSVGYTGCFSGMYARKHNPAINFPSLPSSANQPFTAFPSDYSSLPQVSFVVPNLQDDMHDGTVAQGDAWLQNNLAGYIAWAKTHNSVFVLTFDEDDDTAVNQIPTIIAGQQVVPGSYAETVNHYNVLRTVEDAYRLPAIGASATSAPILDIWAAAGGDQPPTATFTSSCVQLSCSFDGSGSLDPGGGSVTSYAWDFGDGSTGTGRTPTHTYSDPGDYSVTLTVTDGAGLRSDPFTQSVNAQVTSAPIRFVGAANAGGGNTKAKAVVVPAAGQVGDTAVLLLTTTSGSVWSGPSGVSGWTRVDGLVGGGLSTTVWVKRLVAGDAGAAVRFASSGYSHASVDVAVYSGVDAAAPVAGFAHSSDAGGVSHTTPGVSAAAGDFVVSLWGDRSASTRSWSAPAGLVSRDASTDSGSSLTVQALVADADAAGAGGPAGGLTARTDAATSGTAMWTVVLHAA